MRAAHPSGQGEAGAARTRLALAPRLCGRSLARGLRCYGGGGSLLQLDGSAPIFSPRSAILFIVSLMKTPGCGGTQSLGTATNRTSTVAPRFSREISACACRCRIDVSVAARKVSEVGGSVRDVQQLAGHASLQTTQRYIEGDTDAKRKLVQLI
jgi:hypothetical protein